MSSFPRAAFTRDEAGVSEVLGYLLAFFMSVMILVVSIYAFSILQTAGRDQGAKAQLQEVVNRVALGVQESLQVAAARSESIGSANSTNLRFSRSITAPATIQGWSYQVALDKNFINGTVPTRNLAVSVPTFNAAVSLPPVGVCTKTYTVCTLSGTHIQADGQIVMTYLFDESVIPIVNKIEIA